MTNRRTSSKRDLVVEQKEQSQTRDIEHGCYCLGSTPPDQLQEGEDTEVKQRPKMQTANKEM